MNAITKGNKMKDFKISEDRKSIVIEDEIDGVTIIAQADYVWKPTNEQVKGYNLAKMIYESDDTVGEIFEQYYELKTFNF
jgi:hypothetical protein